ncbi:MAG: polymer-forming cytoskeletal protein [Myxococcota bacterium]|nr:polymer-forming cytoskeletal protein [Myxococcota bacterium]
MGLFGNKNEQASAPEESKGSGLKSTGSNEGTQTTRSKGFESGDTNTGGDSPSSRGNLVATIGKSIIFKGELTGSEDLEVNGTVEGDVKLPDNTLTIGQTGRVTASVSAKSILIVGKVEGNVSATERIEIEASGIVNGDLRAPRLLVQEGAVMNGSVQMTSAKPAEATKSPAASSSRPGSTAATAGGPPPAGN